MEGNRMCLNCQSSSYKISGKNGYKQLFGYFFCFKANDYRDFYGVLLEKRFVKLSLSFNSILKY